MRNIAKQFGHEPSDTTNSDWLKLKDYPEAKEALHPVPKNLPFKTVRGKSFVWDRLRGNYQKPDDMRFIRYYDQQVFTAGYSNIVWLKDLKQYVLESTIENCDDAACIDGDWWYETGNAPNAFYCERADVWCYRSNAVYLQDSGEYVQQRYAERNCYQSSDGDWYEDEDNCREVDSGGLQSYDTRAEEVLGFGDESSCLRFEVVGDHKVQDKSGRWLLKRMAKPVPMFLGVELEVDTDDRREFAEKINSRGKFVIAKEDGSLNDDTGIELVTRPLSLVEQQAQWEKFLTDNAKYIEAPERGYGLHVHISKNCLTKIEEARICKFVCHEEHRNFMLAFSRRDSSGDVEQWACFSRNNLNTRYFQPRNKPNLDDLLKYSAVNLCHSATIEFRFFASTIDYQELMQSIEFCQAIAHYVHETRNLAAVKCLNLRAFAVWVNMKKDTYPALAKYVQGQFDLLTIPLLAEVA